MSNLLHAAIAAVCPIDGVAIGDPENKATWRIDFAAGATAEQQAAAAAALAAFDAGRLAVPEAITRMQLRLWLRREKQKTAADVEAAIAAIADAAAREEALIEWQDAFYVHRINPLVDQLGTALGMNAAEIDAAFIAAGAL